VKVKNVRTMLTMLSFRVCSPMYGWMAIQPPPDPGNRVIGSSSMSYMPPPAMKMQNKTMTQVISVLDILGPRFPLLMSPRSLRILRVMDEIRWTSLQGH
jgi:hypothetical protein